MEVEGTHVTMEIVESKNTAERTYRVLLGIIGVSYACANCEELLPRMDRGDGVIEIQAQCPNCMALNRARII